MSLRSQHWFGGQSMDASSHRASLKAEGFGDFAFDGRPVIGICNTWSELVDCNAHLRDLAEAVRRGVLVAGGLPLEFPVLSLGEILMSPTTMLYRNLMAMDVEESIRAYPLDGVVLLSGCDKTQPACLMGAASADVPAIVLTGGPKLSGHWGDEELGSGTDAWRLRDELRAGRITVEDWNEIEGSISRSCGHCMTMGTASTMACVTEALGMCLPGTAAIPAADSRRRQAAEATGRAIVDLVQRDLKPSAVLTRHAFENAIRALQAISGSTNAIIHLIALAGRVGVDLPLSLFDELAEDTPWLVDLKPAGRRLMEDFYYAGGLPAVLAQIKPLLHLDALTVSGRTLGENIAQARTLKSGVIASAAEPLSSGGGLIVLHGNLCPDGAVLKRSAASEALMQHEGLAVVFDDIEDLDRRIDAPDLDVTPDSVLVLRNTGPIGAPGMPEWGKIPIPRKLLAAGVHDMVRISDCRMSGTAYGAVVLHAAPEAAVGGPLALVRTGDRIRLDAANRRLDVLVSEAELAARKAEWRPRPSTDTRGYRSLFLRHVLQANEGCDFDFLRGHSPVMTAVRGPGGTSEPRYQ